MKMVRERINDVSAKYTFPRYSSVFNNEASSQSLEVLQASFVLVPVDKASKNISFVCKSYYMEVLLNEMNTNADTYSLLAETSSDLVRIHKQYSNKLLLSSESDKIPYTYWTPKFHKPVLSQRFIVSYGDCYIKSLSHNLSLALGCVNSQIESFCKMLYRCTGVRHYWVIKSSMEILEYVNVINNRKSGRNITTYDFTTLYTKLEHTQILEAMFYVIDLAFKKSKQKYISVYKKAAGWANNPRASTFKFDQDSLKGAIEFVITNSYFTIGSLCFHQLIGVPIGIDCGPHIANLTLFYYEYKFIDKLIRRNYKRALRYNGCFRLMDDISCLNLDGVFLEDVSDIYPPSLELKKENVGTESANILDLTISINSSKNGFDYKLFDKREAFKFGIVNYPDVSGNISASCAYGVVKSELLRYAQRSSIYSEFLSRKSTFFNKIIDKKGYDILRCNKIAASIKDFS